VSGIDANMSQYTLVDRNLQIASGSYILSLEANDTLEIIFYSIDATVMTMGTQLFSIPQNASSVDIFQLA
jgi:hypothetical protein